MVCIDMEENVFRIFHIRLVNFLENIFSRNISLLKMRKITSLVEVGKTSSSNDIPHRLCPPQSSPSNTPHLGPLIQRGY